MEDYDITTLPEGYEPMSPDNTGGFRIFITFCCIAVLCLGGFGMYNWLETGNIMGKRVETVAGHALEPRPEEVPKLEHEVQPQIYTKFDVKTKDGVTITIEVTTIGELSIEERDFLRALFADVFYADVTNNRGILQSWADQNDVVGMRLTSSKPLTSPEQGGTDVQEGSEADK